MTTSRPASVLILIYGVTSLLMNACFYRDRNKMVDQEQRSELIVTSFRLPFVTTRREDGTVGRTESRDEWARSLAHVVKVIFRLRDDDVCDINRILFNAIMEQVRTWTPLEYDTQNLFLGWTITKSTQGKNLCYDLLPVPSTGRISLRNSMSLEFDVFCTVFLKQNVEDHPIQ